MALLEGLPVAEIEVAVVDQVRELPRSPEINSARTLGLTVPPTLIATADAVIE